MININNALNFMNPLKSISSFLTATTFNWAAAASMAVNYISSKKAAKQAAAGASSAQASQQEGLDEQKRQYDLGQENLKPYQEAGIQSLGQYQGMLSSYQPSDIGGFQGQYQDPGAFQSNFNNPNFNVNLGEDPSYKFRVDQGLEALDRQMAKGGNRNSGRRGMALQQYGQDMASQEYSAAYNRANTGYNRDYGAQTDQFNRDRQQYGLDTQYAGDNYQRSLQTYGLDYQRNQDINTQQVQQMGRYAGLAGSGQRAAGASSTLGSSYANQFSQRQGNIGKLAQQGANFQAAGTLGMGNAITSGLAAYGYGQGQNQSNFSGLAGINRGSQQDMMLAEQNRGFN